MGLSPRHHAVVRAVCLAVALLGHGIYALPMPRSLTLETLREEDGRENVDRWLGWLRGAGLTLQRDDFEQWVLVAANTLHDGHTWAKAPFKPWMDLSGNGQSWGLFAVPDRWPVRLEILVWTTGGTEWTLAYRRLDAEHDLLADVLSYRRIRGIYDGQIGKPRAAYKNLTRWLARRIFATHPDVERVQVQGRKSHTTLPTEPADPKDEVVSPRPHRRENHAGGAP
jgi:hypothetical protein